MESWMWLSDQWCSEYGPAAAAYLLFLGDACQLQLACNLLSILLLGTLDGEHCIGACLKAEVKLAVSIHSRWYTVGHSAWKHTHLTVVQVMRKISVCCQLPQLKQQGASVSRHSHILWVHGRLR